MLLNFGIKLSQELASRIFLCADIQVDHAVDIAILLQSGELPVEKFIEKTTPGMQAMLADKGHALEERYAEWSGAYGEFSADDYTFLQDNYQISRNRILCLPKRLTKSAISSPKQLGNEVKKYVRGQDEAIEMLSVPFFQHMQSKQNRYNLEFKAPCLIVGPTGVGKSEMIKRFADLMNCPVIRINTSDITATSWKGESINDVLARHLADGMKAKDMEYAIVVFHEIDKVTQRNRRMLSEGGSDLGFDMQRNIMRLFESKHQLHLTMKNEYGLNGESCDMPTENMMFVFDGCFAGMEQYIKRRLNCKESIGFGQKTENKFDKDYYYLQHLVGEDLVSWGMMEELVGRICGNVVVMNPLSSDAIYDIIKNADQNVLLSHVKYCAANYHTELAFEEEALHYIAELAFQSGLGFRNVRMLLSKALNKFYYNLESDPSHEMNKVLISKEFVVNQLNK